MHGKDCVLNGHMLQAKPIGDVEAYREPSPEERRKAEKAEASERTEGVVTRSDLGNQGQLFFQEFQDVVMLRHVHRTYDENDERVREMSSGERAQFLAEGKRFQEVMERISDLTWTMEDHAWLANWRNRSVLARTREGRELH